MNKEFITKWTSQLKKGTLSFLILRILQDGKEFYGYDLINVLKKQAEVDIAEGTLYPLMNRLKTENLVDSKWIEQSSGIPRKYYSITTAGIETLSAMSDYWNKLTNTINEI